jgi:hypothetical protein
MSDKSGIPRYGLRKRPANDSLSHPKSKYNHPCLPSRNAPSGVAQPTTPASDIRRPTISPLTPRNTPTRSHIRFESGPSTDTATAIPHKLTINGRTFTGPLHPNKTTDPSRNAANIPGNHGGYELFVCADCPPIPQEDEQDGLNDQTSRTDLHTLCYPSHPCIWSFPPKALEAFANRNHWLELDKPIEETRRANGRLPRLLDEDGESVTRGLVDVQKGVDLNRAYDEMAMRRYLAVVKPEECCEMRGVAEGEKALEDYRFLHREARERLLEDMGWGFQW